MSDLDHEALLALAREDLDRRKVATEIIKLSAEIKKITREHQLIAKHPLRLPSGYVPLLVAVITLAGVLVKWQLDSITAERRDVEKSSQVVGLEAALAKAAPTSPVSTVRIRFRGSIKRELMTSLQQSLNASGFIAPPPVRTAAVESTSLSYYAPMDKAEAERVAAKTAEVFRASGCSVLPVPKLVGSINQKPRTVDLDIYATCR